MQIFRLITLLLALVIIYTPVASNAQTQRVGQTWLFVEPANGTAMWKAEAISQTVQMNLSEYKRIFLQEEKNLADTICNLKDVNCILNLARSQNIDIVLIGKVTNRMFHIESFDPRSNSLSDSEEVHFGNKISIQEFNHKIFQLVKPFVQIGGILDEQPPKTSHPIIFFFVGILGAMAVSLFIKFSFLRLKILFPPEKRSKNILALKFFITTLFLGILGVGVFQSVKYHPHYLEKMKVSKIKIEKLKQLQRERNRGKR